MNKEDKTTNATIATLCEDCEQLEALNGHIRLKRFVDLSCMRHMHTQLHLQIQLGLHSGSRPPAVNSNAQCHKHLVRDCNLQLQVQTKRTRKHTGATTCGCDEVITKQNWEKTWFGHCGWRHKQILHTRNMSQAQSRKGRGKRSASQAYEVDSSSDEEANDTQLSQADGNQKKKKKTLDKQVSIYYHETCITNFGQELNKLVGDLIRYTLTRTFLMHTLYNRIIINLCRYMLFMDLKKLPVKREDINKNIMKENKHLTNQGNGCLR
jgi:hypothetical protein